MKRTFLSYISFICLLLAVGFVFMQARNGGQDDLEARLYQEWQDKFIVRMGDQAYVKTNTSKREDITFSESQGYAMLIAVQAAQHQTGQEQAASEKDFKDLYQYYLSHRLKDSQLMAWQQTWQSGKMKNQDLTSATDGDLYIAYALIQAADLWKDEEGAYLKQAKAILADILSYNLNTETNMLTVGDWADSQSEFYNLVRTSDILPAQFDTFYQVTKDQRWLTIKDAMLDALSKVSQDYDTGLISDFIWVKDNGQVSVVSPNTVASKYDGAYSSNACRLPYNLAPDKDPRSQKILNRMLDFFKINPKYMGPIL